MADAPDPYGDFVIEDEDAGYAAGDQGDEYSIGEYEPAEPSSGAKAGSAGDEGTEDTLEQGITPLRERFGAKGAGQ